MGRGGGREEGKGAINFFVSRRVSSRLTRPAASVDDIKNKVEPIMPGRENRGRGEGERGGRGRRKFPTRPRSRRQN
jgi:hypothetical protein